MARTTGPKSADLASECRSTRLPGEPAVTRFLRIGRPDDVYSPDFTAPSPDKARTHVTVHDLAWLHPEAETPPPLANFLAPVVERSVRSATTVFTVSEAIRQKSSIVTRFPRSGSCSPRMLQRLISSTRSR